MITALAGGVGAARFLTGLTKLVREEDLSVIVNTGDDMEMFGLHISPDLDIVSYALAGIVDDEKGWGIKNDTFQCLEMLKKIGFETWFSIGDRDFATHIFRTDMLRKGFTLSKVTEEICQRIGVKVKIMPMTDDKFETWIKIEEGLVHFEEYFVKRQAGDRVLDVKFVGAAHAKPAPKVVDSILNAEMVVICPSNPIVSIGTILSVDGVRDALKKTKAKVVGVSPIIAGAPVKGPADKLMRGLGFEVSAFSVAKLYKDFLDTFLIDTKDADEKCRIEQLNINVKVADTVMKCVEDKVGLAKSVLES
ncbi:MAG TPA: 2-phospho-L-lactate transferase [Candidatus Limnocylindrales bacterium]|nr:2-phospho-L-lactate transferase [Candidatus Limnocylindrales bacterium]